MSRLPYTSSACCLLCATLIYSYIPLSSVQFLFLCPDGSFCSSLTWWLLHLLMNKIFSRDKSLFFPVLKTSSFADLGTLEDPVCSRFGVIVCFHHIISQKTLLLWKTRRSIFLSLAFLMYVASWLVAWTYTSRFQLMVSYECVMKSVHFEQGCDLWHDTYFVPNLFYEICFRISTWPQSNILHFIRLAYECVLPIPYTFLMFRFFI